MYSQFKAKKEALQHQNKDDVLAKYGNTGGWGRQGGAMASALGEVKGWECWRW
jgi:hypothetical protein